MWICRGCCGPLFCSSSQWYRVLLLLNTCSVRRPHLPCRHQIGRVSPPFPPSPINPTPPISRCLVPSRVPGPLVYLSAPTTALSLTVLSVPHSATTLPPLPYSTSTFLSHAVIQRGPPPTGDKLSDKDLKSVTSGTIRTESDSARIGSTGVAQDLPGRAARSDSKWRPEGPALACGGQPPPRDDRYGPPTDVDGWVGETHTDTPVNASCCTAHTTIILGEPALRKIPYTQALFLPASEVPNALGDGHCCIEHPVVKVR